MELSLNILYIYICATRSTQYVQIARGIIAETQSLVLQAGEHKIKPHVVEHSSCYVVLWNYYISR